MSMFVFVLIILGHFIETGRLNLGWAHCINTIVLLFISFSFVHVSIIKSPYLYRVFLSLMLSVHHVFRLNITTITYLDVAGGGGANSCIDVGSGGDVLV